MIVWDSKDLVNWENERIIDFSQSEETKSADRVWVPQMIFDKFKNEYMIYWTHNNSADNLNTITWYAYTKDFKTLTTRSKVPFKPKNGLCGIDADIIEVNGKYYLYKADGEQEAIFYAVHTDLTDLTLRLMITRFGLFFVGGDGENRTRVQNHLIKGSTSVVCLLSYPLS